MSQIRDLDVSNESIIKRAQESHEFAVEWIKALFEETRESMEPRKIPPSKAYCGFCGRGDAIVGLVEGPAVCICKECAENAIAAFEMRE